MTDRSVAEPDQDTEIVDAPDYYAMPFEEGVRLLMERYGTSSDWARLMMALAHGLSDGDARAVDTPPRTRRRSKSRPR